MFLVIEDGVLNKTFLSLKCLDAFYNMKESLVGLCFFFFCHGFAFSMFSRRKESFKVIALRQYDF